MSRAGYISATRKRKFLEEGEALKTYHASQESDPCLSCGAERWRHEWIDFGQYGACAQTGCAAFVEPKQAVSSATPGASQAATPGAGSSESSTVPAPTFSKEAA